MNCGKEEIHSNYCSWECNIELAKKNGGKVYQPNGLPINCIMANGDMYEIGHGDHPDYKFPVKVIFCGQREELLELPDWDDTYCDQFHALIYFDDSIAMTLYECNYTIWSLWDNGRLVNGPRWVDKTWILDQESIDKIKDYSKK